MEILEDSLLNEAEDEQALYARSFIEELFYASSIQKQRQEHTALHDYNPAKALHHYLIL